MKNFEKPVIIIDMMVIADVITTSDLGCVTNDCSTEGGEF